MSNKKKAMIILTAAVLSIGSVYVWGRYCAPWLMQVFHVTH